jgi:hypothetical protein
VRDEAAGSGSDHDPQAIRIEARTRLQWAKGHVDWLYAQVCAACDEIDRLGDRIADLRSTIPSGPKVQRTKAVLTLAELIERARTRGGSEATVRDFEALLDVAAAAERVRQTALDTPRADDNLEDKARKDQAYQEAAGREYDALTRLREVLSDG